MGDALLYKKGIGIMEEKEFRELAVKSVVDYFNEQADSTDKNGKITEDEVFIVWECKILQNNKALLSTTIPDGMYYEVTWNGDKNEGYLDAYKKWKNIVIHRIEDEDVIEDDEAADKERIYEVVGYKIPNDKCYTDLIDNTRLRNENKLFSETVLSSTWIDPYRAIAIVLKNMIRSNWEEEQFMKRIDTENFVIEVILDGNRLISQYNPDIDDYLDSEL